MVSFEKVGPGNVPKGYNSVIYSQFEKSRGYNHCLILLLMLEFVEFILSQDDRGNMYTGLILLGMADQEVTHMNIFGQTRKERSKVCALDFGSTHFYTHLKVLSNSLKHIGYFRTLSSKLQESYFLENHKHKRFLDSL